MYSFLVNIVNTYIADDVRIVANAVVTKSCYTKGAVLLDRMNYSYSRGR